MSVLGSHSMLILNPTSRLQWHHKPSYHIFHTVTFAVHHLLSTFIWQLVPNVINRPYVCSITWWHLQLVSGLQFHEWYWSAILLHISSICASASWAGITFNICTRSTQYSYTVTQESCSCGSNCYTLFLVIQLHEISTVFRMEFMWLHRMATLFKKLCILQRSWNSPGSLYMVFLYNIHMVSQNNRPVIINFIILSQMDAFPLNHNVFNHIKFELYRNFILRVLYWSSSNSSFGDNN
jgi:hypothetical protein